MGCNENELDWTRHWWGDSLEWKITDDQAKEIEEAAEAGDSGLSMAAIGLASRGGALPAGIAEALSVLCKMYADDIGDAAQGCGVVIEWHWTPVTGIIPWYTIESQ